MAKKKTISLTQARKQFFDIADEVQEPHTYYELTEHGTPKVVVMGAKEFESWEKTIALVESKTLSSKDIQAFKQATSFKRLEDILEKEGFIVADKARHTYDPSGLSQQTRRTRAGKGKQPSS